MPWSRLVRRFATRAWITARRTAAFFRPPESVLVLEQDWLASFRRAWACCSAFTPAHACSTRPCSSAATARVLTPRSTPTRAGYRFFGLRRWWCSWAATPVMATTQRPCSRRKLAAYTWNRPEPSIWVSWPVCSRTRSTPSLGSRRPRGPAARTGEVCPGLDFDRSRKAGGLLCRLLNLGNPAAFPARWPVRDLDQFASAAALTEAHSN